MKRVYLDWAATSPVDSKVLEQMSDAALRFPGNPSSIHTEGKAARQFLEKDRGLCAELLGTQKKRIFFTSGGTESNEVILRSLLLKKKPGNILISGIEHPSLFEYIHFLKNFGYSVTVLYPDKYGIIQPQTVEKKLQQNTAMVIIMAVNNETGAVQPLDDIVRIVRNFERKNNQHIHIHTDAVQALGKIHFHVEELDIDSASFSAHKIQGPRGVGILYAKTMPGVLSVGGGQESGLRPGTENLAGIHGLATAMEQYFTNFDIRVDHAEKLMEILRAEYRSIPEIQVLERTPKHSPFIINASVKHFPGEVFIRVMDDRGFAISSGSACSSRNKEKKARVLSAMGLSQERSFHSFRVSTGVATTEEDIHRFARAINDELNVFRRK